MFVNKDIDWSKKNNEKYDFVWAIVCFVSDDCFKYWQNRKILIFHLENILTIEDD